MTKSNLQRRLGGAELALLAAFSFLPLLLVKPGIVTSDTKTYLYLDPAKFLSQVANMWNPTVGLGTVTHEYIGYLFPMGPFFLFFSALHVPVWVAQRLWLGSILFLAGLGIIYLSRIFKIKAPGRTVGALAYMLSPYFLQYSGRISVILLPWAGLPWMLAFTILALRKGGWKYPALFALVTAAVSGINASSVLYVGLAPVIWLIYAAAIEKEATWRRVCGVALQIGFLTFLCCLWWIVGLEVEAAFGVDVLKYTETIPATSSASTAGEVIRGLGYWYFYGSDALGPWTMASVTFTQDVWLICLTYLLPIGAFVASIFTRWRQKAFFIALVVVGVTLSVGPHPFNSPTPFGGVLKAFMDDTTAGFAMRSTDRATPLVLLGLAMLLGSGIAALHIRVPVGGLVTAAAIGALVIAANPAMFNGEAEVASGFTQPASLPSYEQAAIKYLNSLSQSTRVLAIPGNNFASYDWGDTVDTPQPALLTRPFATHEQQIMGSIPTADTLYAMDVPIQTNIEDWTGLAPMARLLSASNLLVEYDQAYTHYGVPQPEWLAADLHTTPVGLTNPKSFGTPTPNISKVPTLNEQDLANTANPTWPSPLVTYTIPGARPLVRAESTQGALVVAGDATGLQNLANQGLLNTTSAIYYAGNLSTGRIESLERGGATFVLTDTNRKQGFRWDTLTANAGETETSTETLAKTTPSDSPIDLFPNAKQNAHTLATYQGATNVTASAYGNTVSYTPEDRPYAAVDGDADTSWLVGTFTPDPKGQWWQIHYPSKINETHIRITQPQRGTLRRWITKVTFTFDGGQPLTVTLNATSRSPNGQEISFPRHAFKTLRITIDATNNDDATSSSAGAVGFSEITMPRHPTIEVIQMPKDLLDSTGAGSIFDRLILSMSRERVSPFPPRTDPETTITRQVTLPTSRSFRITGTASMSTLIPDDSIDRLVGMPGSTGSGVIGYSNARLPGSLNSTASAAIDGNPKTAWQPGFGTTHQVGDSIHYSLHTSISMTHMNLQVLADGRHSVPTSIRVTMATDTGTVTGTQKERLPAIKDSKIPGSVATIPLSFPPMTGSQLTITITGVRFVKSKNYYSSTPIALPVGIATLGIPGLSSAPIPSTLPGDCQSNLIRINGNPVSVRVEGSSSKALQDGTVSLVPCGFDTDGVTLHKGSNIIQTTVAHVPSTPDCVSSSSCTGWNVNSLVLDSAPDGGPEGYTGFSLMPGGGAHLAPPKPGAVPAVTVRAHHITSMTLGVSDVSGPFELVLGESINAGWHAEVHAATGKSMTLGAPQLMDAFANGWHLSGVDYEALGNPKSLSVTLTWTPQQMVWDGLAISALTGLLCLIIGFLPEALRRRIRVSISRVWGKKVKGRHKRTAYSDSAKVGRTKTSFATTDPGPILSLPHKSNGRVPAGWESDGSAPAWWASVLIALLAGFLASALSYSGAGILVGIVVLLGLRFSSLRVLASLGAMLCLIAVVIWIANSQAAHPASAGPGWAQAYEDPSDLVWYAVVLLGADGVVSAGRGLAHRRAASRRLQVPIASLEPSAPT